MEGGFLSILTVPICFWLAVIVCVGMSLVVLKSIDVLILLVAVWVRTVNQDWGGTIPVQNRGFYLGHREGASG